MSSEITTSMSFDANNLTLGLPRSNGWDGLTLNANPTGLTPSQIELGIMGHAFVPDLIKRRKELFSARDHRYEVSISDPIAHFVGVRYIEEMCAKPFKSYDIDVEGNPEEAMMDLWERWEQLKANEPLQAFYNKEAFDGYCLARMIALEMGSYTYRAYGYFESPPDYWKRINMPWDPRYHNIIYQYYINYIPRPNGTEYCNNYNLHAEEEYISPQEPGFFHLYRGKWNHGVGVSRFQPIWASTTMLRKISFADYRRSSIFNQFLYPEDWDSEKGIDEMIEAIRRVDEMEGIALPMRINPLTKEVEEWPKFGDRTMDQMGAAPKADPSAGGTLLRNPEYARLLIALGYTETKLVGSQPGEVTGSKLDLTRDDEVDIREFQFVIPIIKQMLLWFLENGYLEGLEAETLERVAMGDFDIKCHVEWEVLENQVREAELAAEEMENQAESQGDRQNTALLEFRLNSFAQEMILSALRNNQNSPFIDVASSWVQQVGVLDNRLWFKFKGWPGYAGYDLPNNEMAYSKMLDAIEGTTTKHGKSGSTGAWMWENIWDAGGKGPRPQKSPFMGMNIHYAKDPFSYIDADRPFNEQKWLESSQMLTQGTLGLQGTQGTGAAMKLKPTSKRGGKNMDQQASRKTPKARVATTSVSDVASVRSSQTPTIRRHAAIEGLSFSRANSLMKDATGEGFSSKTWVRFKNMIAKFEEQNNFRVNSAVIGNPMSFDVPLQYMVNGKKITEFACKREWKKIIAHEGDLYLYEDLEHGGKRINVGKYKYWYNEDTDKPSITYIKEEVYPQVEEQLIKWNKQNSRLFGRLKKDLPLSLSTEYYTGKPIEHEGRSYQVGFHDGTGSPVLKGIAIVNLGNCDEPFCNFEVIEE